MTEEDKMIPLGNVIRIDDERIKRHIDRVVRGTGCALMNRQLNTIWRCRQGTQKRAAWMMSWSGWPIFVMRHTVVDSQGPERAAGY